MLIVLYLDSVFLPGKLLFFFFLKRNLRHLKIEYFVETLECNISVLSNFISLQGIFSGQDLWTPYIVSATKRTFSHQAYWKVYYLSFLLHCCEQMFPQHFWIILMHKMRKQEIKRKRPALISVTRKLHLSRGKCLYSQSLLSLC